MSICERGGFGIEIEEVVHQESAEVKAVFDDSSVNEFSGGGVSGFDSRLEKIDVCVGLGVGFWDLH